MNYGEILKNAREKKNLSIKEISFTSKIPHDMIAAFEEMDIVRIPVRVYARPFLERYIRLLGLGDEFSAGDFLNEVQPKEPLVSLPGGGQRKHIPRFMVAAGIAILIGSSLIAYGFYQFRFYIFMPKLVVKEPARDIATGETAMRIKGTIGPDASLTLNGRPIYSDEAGEFKETVYLASGLNTLEFEAVNQAGKATKIIRYILVKN
ncbi:MAG: hypothetical protein A2934_00100 [Candidatus Sungbacteria bacterium RIFCSPLOWO2_01_FULL_47_10]|uniref:HTH cro/C1-type domain-containing protein n=1 Tax=Candidatus Sungbacteria bacterium RIFCSPLOWO2_01_FULL_47_10 TaxID=1802276 RepID=A0A1G2L6R4_9BACT|nr:MAG: hypothetical protein A2934_00100 [Candidatus Sungbacteria bacterium RIFCSPLOWO2_01_FULL_47_10]